MGNYSTQATTMFPVFGSAYMGSVRYYAALLAAGKGVIDTAQHIGKHSWKHNHCRILGANGVQTLAVPIEKCSSLDHKLTISDLKISEHGDWRRIHWGAIFSAYGKTPFFEYIEDDLKQVYDHVKDKDIVLNVISKSGTTTETSISFRIFKELVESKVTTMDGYALAEPLDGEEAFKIELNHPVSVNMFAFKNHFFVYLDEYFKKYFRNDDEYILDNEALLPELIKEKLNEKQIELQNLVSNSSWFGMTYKEDLIGLKENIEKLILKGEYPRKLWE